MWEIALHLVGVKKITAAVFDEPEKITKEMKYYNKLRADPQRYREYLDKLNAYKRNARARRKNATS